MRRLIRNYEEVWGHYQGSGQVLQYLKDIEKLEAIPSAVTADVRGHYQQWHDLARKQLDQLSEQFPELVGSMQERLGKRMVLLAEAEATRAQELRGLLPHGRSEALLQDIDHQLNLLRGETVEKLQINAEKLLRRVPLFRDLDESTFQQLLSRLRPHTLDSNEVIIEQGELGDSLYLIARGVVRVSCREEEVDRDLGTLMAGDFFGEMALMHHESRNATIRTITPCKLYELPRQSLEDIFQYHPEIEAQLRQLDAARRQELDAPSPDNA